MSTRDHASRDSSVCTQDGVSEGLIQYTIDFWSKYTSQEITAEDAKEMIINVRSYSRILGEMKGNEEGEGGSGE